MILSVSFRRDWHYGETWDEMSQLISDVVENLESEGLLGERQVWDPGENAWFCFAQGRHSSQNRVSDNFLQVAVNRSTGYGALAWGVDANSPRKGGIFDSVWISDNPEPPDFDPRLIADPDCAMFHDPRSAIPLSRVRAALEEFCRTGTGDRPECIDWVRGDLFGRRADREYLVPAEAGEMPDDPWA